MYSQHVPAGPVGAAGTGWNGGGGDGGGDGHENGAGSDGHRLFSQYSVPSPLLIAPSPSSSCGAMLMSLKQPGLQPRAANFVSGGGWWVAM